MSLAVSNGDVARLAAELRSSGITNVEVSFRGPLVQYIDGVEVARAVVALQRLREYLSRIEGKDGRRQFIELLEKAMK